MGTYQKQFTINWLNLNPVEKTITIEYQENIVLDTSQSVPGSRFQITRHSEDWDNFYNTVISIADQPMTLGLLLTQLTATEIMKDNPEFLLL